LLNERATHFRRKLPFQYDNLSKVVPRLTPDVISLNSIVTQGIPIEHQMKNEWHNLEMGTIIPGFCGLLTIAVWCSYYSNTIVLRVEMSFPDNIFFASSKLSAVWL
jgi:hypothetical protein